MNPRAVVLLSGGIDSTTTLAVARTPSKKQLTTATVRTYSL